MTVTIDLRPDIEARLAAIARERGMSLAQFASYVLEAQLPRKKHLTAAERLAVLRNFAKDLPRTEPLSDEAISRESLYGDRG